MASRFRVSRGLGVLDVADSAIDPLEIVDGVAHVVADAIADHHHFEIVDRLC